MCRLACKDCEPCAVNDQDCIAKNREKGGYINAQRSEFKGFLDDV